MPKFSRKIAALVAASTLTVGSMSACSTSKEKVSPAVSSREGADQQLAPYLFDYAFDPGIDVALWKSSGTEYLFSWIGEPENVEAAFEGMPVLVYFCQSTKGIQHLDFPGLADGTKIECDGQVHAIALGKRQALKALSYDSWQSWIILNAKIYDASKNHNAPMELVMPIRPA